MNDQSPVDPVIHRLASGNFATADARSLLVALGRMAAGDRPLPPLPEAVLPALLEAGREVIANVEAEIPRLGSLDDRWHDADGQAEADTVVAAPLAMRLDALFAIDGLEALADITRDRGFNDAAQSLAAASVAFDRAIRKHLGCLATLADGGTLKDWRRSLPEGMDALPWWLDGTLERHAAAVARQTDAMSARFAATFAGRQVVRPAIPGSASATAAISDAARLSLAAAAPAADAVTRHVWRHPSRPLEALLWVPATFDDSADIRIVFRDTAGGDAEHDLIGEVMLLHGMPAVVHLTVMGGSNEVVEASWPAKAVAGALGEPAVLGDARGEPWIPAD